MSPTILSRRYAPAASVQSVVLRHAFGLPAIVAGWTWCATSTASAATERTATTTMHSTTHRHDCHRLCLYFYESSYVTLSGCQLLSQGGPRVRQARQARGKRAVVLPHAFGLPAFVVGWTSSATSTASAAAANTATTTIHSPTHRWLRKALRIQRCTARPLFTRPAWPRRALR